MSIDSHSIVQPDNRLWLSDLTRWEQEVADWQRELAVTTAELECTADAVEGRRKALESDFQISGGALLTQHRIALEDHRKALEGHRDRLRGELAFLTEYEIATVGGKTGEPPETLRPTDTLAQHVARHPQLWEAHERLGRRHQAVIDATTSLIRALAPPT